MLMGFLWIPPHPTTSSAPLFSHKSPPSSPALRKVCLQDNGKDLWGQRSHRQSLTMTFGGRGNGSPQAGGAELESATLPTRIQEAGVGCGPLQ